MTKIMSFFKLHLNSSLCIVVSHIVVNNLAVEIHWIWNNEDFGGAEEETWDAVRDRQRGECTCAEHLGRMHVIEDDQKIL